MVACLKGGADKTTTVHSIASVAARSGLSVLVIDTDVVQKSLARHVMRAQERLGENDVPFDCKVEADPDEIVKIRSTFALYDVIVIDTPGHLEGPELLAATVAVSDFLIVPTKPALGDMEDATTTIEAVQELRPLPYKVLFTEVHAQRGKAATVGMNLMREDGHDTFEDMITWYSMYPDAQATGLLVTEFPKHFRPRGPLALAEWQGVWSETQSLFLKEAS